jgi:ornithine decarboxylase
MSDRNAKVVSHYSNPFFLFDLDRVRAKYDAISSAFRGAETFYAVKANNHRQVLSILVEMGCGFEIGSKHEAELLFDLGVSPERLIFSSPVKLPSHIRDTFRRGVDFFVFDSEEELNKLAILAPHSKVLVRLAVSNEGSMFPLSLKFGTPANDAIALMKKARELDLTPYGIAFHVGSQCKRKETWREAMEASAKVWRALEKEGMKLRCMDIGGGFPIAYNGEVPSIEAIAHEVRKVLIAKFPAGVELVIEPGRYMVGDAAMLVATVIGKAKRGDENWLFLDVGAFHGLMESLQVKGEFPYRVKASRQSLQQKKYVLTGPTCDPDDTILNEVWLPEVGVGDKIYIMNTGAYSFVYASNFHGFSAPEVRFISERRERTERGIVRDYVGNREVSI